jgi:50S ribosomal subunit-associated GTPase HflX
VINKVLKKIKYFQDSIDLLSVTQSTSIPTIVLANKTDFEQDHVVTERSIEKLKSDVDYVTETSVRTTQSIHQALETAIKLLQTNFIVPEKSHV